MSFKDSDPPDEEITEIMENQDVDQEEAEEIKELMDDLGLDEDDAAELKEAL